MHYFYRIRNDICYHPEIGRYRSSGLDIIKDGSVARSVIDISPNVSFVERIVGACNAHVVDPVHIDAIIEDYLD